jgi:hypothetical protein
VRLDRFIDNAPLEDWEDAVWSSVAEDTRGSREIQSVTGTRLPGVERTNDFLCLVFSCFNGERRMTRGRIKSLSKSYPRPFTSTTMICTQAPSCHTTPFMLTYPTMTNDSIL